jgi:hypothetical protein
MEYTINCRHPQKHLLKFNGILQADAYGGWGKLYDSGRVV